MQKFSDEELLELHQKKLTDRQIGEALDVTQAAVNYRREKLGLKNNYERNTFTDDQLLELYDQGLNDREISKALGVTQAAVNYRRKRLELPSNYIREKAFLSQYQKGLSAEEIASELKAPLRTVIHMMDKCELVSEESTAEADIH